MILKTIKNNREHARAADMVSELIGRDLDNGAGDYRDAQIKKLAERFKLDAAVFIA